MKDRLHRWLDYWRATGVIPRWQLLVVYILVVSTFVVTANWAHDASVRATDVALRVERDAHKRVVESCLTAKTRYMVSRRSLTRTYTFLMESTPEENKSTFNKAIRAGLDKQEQDLRGQYPASFCKKIGPKLPPFPVRPQSLR